MKSQLKETLSVPLFTSRRGLSALALILALALPAAAARADISASDSNTTTSLSGIDTLNTYDQLTPAQQQAILDRYTELAAQIKADQTKATTMRVALDSGKNTDPAITEAAYTALIAKIADTKADAATLRDWISSNSNTSSNNNNSNSNSGGGSSGGSNPLQQIGQQLGQQLSQQLMGGLQGSLQNGIGGLTGGMGNLAGNGTGGSAGGTTDGTGPNSGNLSAADKAAAKKAMEDKKSQEQPCEPTTGSQTADNPGKAADDKVKTGSQTADNAGKAKDDIVATPSTGSQTADNAGKAKDDIAKPAPKMCKSAEVNTPNPTGNATAMQAQLDAIVASGKFLCDSDLSRCSYTDDKGVWHMANGRQCVALTQAWAAAHGQPVGAASGWYGDKRVVDGGIQPGTPIATANYNGKYCDTSAGGCGVPGGHITHTGIFYRYLDDAHPEKGFQMVYQWNGGAPQLGTYTPGNRLDKAQYYYTITTKSTLLDTIPILQPVWMALKLMPVDGGLSNG